MGSGEGPIGNPVRSENRHWSLESETRKRLGKGMPRLSRLRKAAETEVLRNRQQELRLVFNFFPLLSISEWTSPGE
jgi:hypothetical protein